MKKSEVPKFEDVEFYVDEDGAFYAHANARSWDEQADLVNSGPFRDTRAEAEADLPALTAGVRAMLDKMREVADEG